MLLKAFPEIDDPLNGGLVTMEYKMIGFNENEFLRIGMDGHTLSLNNIDSIDW